MVTRQTPVSENAFFFPAPLRDFVRSIFRIQICDLKTAQKGKPFAFRCLEIEK